MERLPGIACCKLFMCGNGGSLFSASPSPSPWPSSRAMAPLLLNTFADPIYNRVGFTLAAPLHDREGKDCGGDDASRSTQVPPTPLHGAVLDMASAAYRSLDLRHHSGFHPRLGVIDNVCLHPLGSASLSSVASMAYAIARDIGSRFQVPTYLYGAAHPEGRPLDAIRRSMGYFKPNEQDQWKGSNAVELMLEPDFGPSKAHVRTGIIAIGASPWVVNYNIPISSNDISLCRRIARDVSARGGGLTGVEALALRHGENVIEIACNLMDSKVTSADTLQQEVTRLAEEEGLSVEMGYFTDYSEEKLIKMTLKLFSEGTTQK